LGQLPEVWQVTAFTPSPNPQFGKEKSFFLALEPRKLCHTCHSVLQKAHLVTRGGAVLLRQLL
jgi:hypothetical protein